MIEWSNNIILKSFPNSCLGHKHTIITPEVTFFGFPTQPDYAIITIEVIPDKLAIELKSVKQYLMQFRDKHISYERLLNTIYNDFDFIYKPKLLKIRLEMTPRGGIQSIVEKGVV